MTPEIKAPESKPEGVEAPKFKPEAGTELDIELEPEDELTPSERFMNTVEGDLFSDIVTRACVLDVILKRKILTRQQLNKVVKLRSEVEKAERLAMPVAIGSCCMALADLDPEGDASPVRDAFEDTVVEATTKFLEKQEKKHLVRSEKLGPLSYPLF